MSCRPCFVSRNKIVLKKDFSEVLPTHRKKAKNSQLELQLMSLLFFLRSPLLFHWEIPQAKENKSKLVVSLVYYVCFCLITEKKKAVVSKEGRKKKLRIQKTSKILCAKKLGKTKKNAVPTKKLSLSQASSVSWRLFKFLSFFFLILAEFIHIFCAQQTFL